MSSKGKGIFLAALGGSMWGVSGILAQLLFHQHQVTSEWLVSARLIVAGFFILLYSSQVKKDPVFLIFKVRKDWIQLILFSLIGMVGVQYFFFKTIEVSNASLATILQFTGPVFVYLYMLLRKEKRLNLVEFALVIVTFFGVLLIVTNGRFDQITISPLGLGMGLASAVAVAFYSLQPRGILAKYGSRVIVGWGMTFAGLVFQFIHPIWRPGFQITPHNTLLLMGVILFGTAIGFLAYLSSLNYIEASLASMLTALEPLLAAILSVVLFQHHFGIYEIIGIALVLSSILLLATFNKKAENTAINFKGDRYA